MRFINIDNLVAGSIDMHMHPGLTTGLSRVDAIEAARQAQQAGMRLFIATLLHHGITPEEIELMVKVNPAGLLGLS